MTPSSAVEYDRSSHFWRPVVRCRMLATATTMMDTIPIHPSGTWK